MDTGGHVSSSRVTREWIWGCVTASSGTHDRWFRDQVGAALQEADDPSTQWVSNEAVMAESAKRREAWRARGARSYLKEYDKLRP